MGYVENLLSSNEKILNRTRRHFLVLLSQIFKEILVLLVLIVGFVALQRWQPEQQTLFQIALGVVMLIVLTSMMIDFLRWHNEEFLVTNRRVVHSSGILSKRVLDSSLSKINDVILQQSWLGRIFGYGTIKILTASDEVINLLDRISNPIGFKHAMLNAKADLEPVPAPAAVSSTSPTQLLEELGQMKARNMISEEEYQEKRKEILKRL